MSQNTGGTGLPTDGKTIFGHPRGLALLFLVEMWERFSYYGMRGLLVLYLTAAIAAHQLAPGQYTNTLRLEQSFKATEAETESKNEPPKATLRLPMNITVGSPAGSPGTTIDGGGGPLVFVPLVKVPDPANPDASIWIPKPGAMPGLSALEFAAKAGTREEGDPIKYRVSNPTDRDVKFVMKIERPFSEAQFATELAKAKKANAKAEKPKSDEDLAKEVRETDNTEYKTYFTVNDSTSVISTTIRPDSKLDADHEPYDLSFNYNQIDSGRSWPKANANTLYGWYTGMAYLLPILGGLIADKLLGTHRSMVVGGLLIALGHIVLGISGIGAMAQSDFGMSVFVGGLAMITIGTGHYKPSVSVMVGQLYPLGDPRRESAFSIFYMGINLGSFLCNLVCGWLAVAYGWHYGFGAAAVGMILGITCYLMFRKQYLSGIGEPAGDTGKLAPIFLPIGIALAAGIGALYHIGVLGLFDELVSQQWAFYSIGTAALAYAVWFIAKQEKGDRGPVATIFIYMLFNALFWLSFEQAGSSLNIFTDELTDRTLGGWKVPTAYFQSINPLLIIIFAPIFGVLWASLARKKKNIGQPFKIGLGLIFVGLGYVVMVFAAMRLNVGVAKVGMIYISGCYFLHTVGEIILSPTGLSYVAKTAPKQHMSSLMGIWFISSFIAGLGAGKVGALVDPIIEGKITLPWHKYIGGQGDFFALFVLTSCLAGVLILVVGTLLTRLQRSRQD